MRAPLLAPILALALAAGVAGCGGGGSSSSAGSGSGGSAGNASSSSAGTSASSTSAALGSTPSTQMGFESVPIEPGNVLAPASTTGTGDVHGIVCGPTEQLVYHIHAHLTVFVDGRPRALPGGIGIPGSQVEPTTKGPYAVGGQCIYWLHTHAPDGVIHIESPTARIYTLGEFFDEWQQPLSANDVAGAHGKVTAFVNGRAWTGSPRAIPLKPHAEVQLDVGTPVPAFQPVNWAATQL